MNPTATKDMGFEGNWVSRTFKLPSGLGQASVEANYSFNHCEARHPTRPDETVPLPRQVDHQAAPKVHGERGNFSLDASMRHRTGWWEDLIARGFDNYIKAVWDAEIGAVYNVGKNTRVTAGICNLLNVPTSHYAGSESRLNDYQRSGIDFNAGVQWKSRVTPNSRRREAAAPQTPSNRAHLR